MGETDLPRTRDVPPTDQAGIRDGMVGGPKGSDGDEGRSRRKDRLFKAQGRKDGRETLGEHGFP